MRRIRKLSSVAVAVAVLLVGATAAMAAQWNSISGTANINWFVSNTDRHVTTPNDTVKAYKTSGCNTLGLEMYIAKASTGVRIGSIRTYTTNGVEQTFATGQPSGLIFHNVFRVHDRSNLNNNCSFAAQEWY